MTVNWICGDFMDQRVPERSFDLVTVMYPVLMKAAGDDAVESLVRGVAEGGMLLVVGHTPEVRETARSQGFDPSRYMEPPDIAARLDPTDWELQLPTREELTSKPSEPSCVEQPRCHLEGKTTIRPGQSPTSCSVHCSPLTSCGRSYPPVRVL